jgi:hypothetical protein
MSKKIVFNVNKEGNVTIADVEGYGSSCLDVTKMLEKALGKADEASRAFTDEYNDPVSLDNKETVKH